MPTMHNLVENVEIKQVQANTAAGTTAVNTASVDMSDAEGCAFVINYGAIGSAGASVVFNVAQSSDDTTFNDLSGTTVTVTGGTEADDSAVVIDVPKPVDQYLRVEADRSSAGTGGEISAITAFKYRTKKMPVTHDSSVVSSSVVVSPDEA